MAMKDRIDARLRESFVPDRLEVVNDSHLHAGHAGDDGTGETHFTVTIRADAFAPMSRLQRHRAIHSALGPAIIGAIHALTLDIG